jgi:hypothetical protein
MKPTRLRVAVSTLLLGTIAASSASAAMKQFNLRDGERRFGRTTGTIQWDTNDIQIVGALLAGGKGASLWLKWEALGEVYNEEVQRAGPARTAKFNRKFTFPGGPSKIRSRCATTPKAAAAENSASFDERAYPALV